jgi:hypothetical protein
MAEIDPDDVKRMEAHMKADFLPVQPRTGGADAAYRMAHALEYAANQLGQINRKLDLLVAALEKQGQPTPGSGPGA